jgi:hypothetical protein
LGPPRPSLAWVSSTSWQLPVLIVALAGWICWLAARRRRETMKCAAVSGRRARARMNEGPVLSSTIATIQAQLQATADPSYKAWSERYMRGAVRCRGVRVPAVVRLAADWWPSASHLSAQRLDMAFQLITSEYAEDKLAGIVCLQLTVPPKHWLARSPPSHVSGDSTAILDRVKETYDGGHVSEWATGDQLCTRVLGPLVQARHLLGRAPCVDGTQPVAPSGGGRRTPCGQRGCGLPQPAPRDPVPAPPQRGAVHPDRRRMAVGGPRPQAP